MVIRGIVKRKQTHTKSPGTKKKTSAIKSKGTIQGAGFVTTTDRSNGLNPVQYGNIIVVENSSAGTAWLSRNSLTGITQSQAQTSYDAFMDNIIDNWNDSDMQPVIKPTKGTLP